MARFHVYRYRHDKDYVLDCQADLLGFLSTRFVVPLVPADAAPVTPRLNPVFTIDEKKYLMATQLASAVGKADLGSLVVSLEESEDIIMNALDMLLTGV